MALYQCSIVDLELIEAILVAQGFVIANPWVAQPSVEQPQVLVSPQGQGSIQVYIDKERECGFLCVPRALRAAVLPLYALLIGDKGRAPAG